MGRGRQKAKQTKVARKLKYFSPDTDYLALQRELAGSNGDTVDDSLEGDDEDDTHEDQEFDDYADWAPRGGH